MITWESLINWFDILLIFLRVSISKASSWIRERACVWEKKSVFFHCCLSFQSQYLRFVSINVELFNNPDAFHTPCFPCILFSFQCCIGIFFDNWFPYILCTWPYHLRLSVYNYHVAIPKRSLIVSFGPVQWAHNFAVGNSFPQTSNPVPLYHLILNLHCTKLCVVFSTMSPTKPFLILYGWHFE